LTAEKDLDSLAIPVQMFWLSIACSCYVWTALTDLGDTSQFVACSLTVLEMTRLAVGGAILFALTAMDSADAARICKDGHFYYGGGETARSKL
jgi:hypothetical protein